MFKRFRDAISGRFTTLAKADRNQSTTVGVSPSKHGISDLNRKILTDALEDEVLRPNAFTSNKILREAIKQVLGR